VIIAPLDVASVFWMFHSLRVAIDRMVADSLA
jgi:hypothetical protein